MNGKKKWNQIEKHIKNKAYEYAKGVINGEISVPRYFVNMCQNFIDVCKDKSSKYFFDVLKFGKIENILKLLIMPRGLKAGKSIFWMFMRLSMTFICFCPLRSL